MKLKAFLATMIGAVAITGATAGEWCPPAAKDKCVIDCCPEYNGNITVGYDTHYIWKGIRFADDFLWADVSYSFDAGLPITPTLGVWHGTDLSSTIGYGDETNIYAGIGLPEILGAEAALTYTYYLFPTFRAPNGGPNGDSLHSIGLSLSRELMYGLTLNSGIEYYWGQNDLSAWYRYAELGKTVAITDCIGVELAAGIAHVDGLYSGLNDLQISTGTGWAHYYVKAGLPIALNCRTTLTPYIGYNGSPDTWKADGVGLIPGANHNDVFLGGVSLSVDF